MNLRTFYIEFEANETVEGQCSYAGPKVWVALAASESHAEELFRARLKKNGLFLENEDGEEAHQYSIHSIPRRAGITEVT